MSSHRRCGLELEAADPRNVVGDHAEIIGVDMKGARMGSPQPEAFSPRLRLPDAPAMKAAERHAIKLLVDRATRAKIQVEGTQRVSLYGRSQRVAPIKTVFFPAGSAS